VHVGKGSPRGVPGSSSDEYSSDEDASDDGGKSAKAKGVSGLIEIDNPNMRKASNVKASRADVDQEVTLSRREREALEAQRAKERYFKLQKEGKTEQARKDLERLALIKQQRAEAAKKREEEKKEREARKNAARNR